MDDEAMKKSLEDILNGASSEGRKKDFDITKDEAKKFKAAMADPEFQAMLRDYMEEMQDPKQRAEQEAYIAQLETQNRVPEGKEVVHPMAGFVVKTSFTRNGKEGQREKLFVNVVSSPKIGPPRSTPSNKGGAGGEMWSLPHAIGPMRMEKDNAGAMTTTFDTCFHPEALVRAQKLDAFRNLVSTSAIEAVESNFEQSVGQKISVEKKFRVLVGVSYKSGACTTMLISKGAVTRHASDRRASSAEQNKPPAPHAEAKAPEGDSTKERKSGGDKPSSVTNDIAETSSNLAAASGTAGGETGRTGAVVAEAKQEGDDSFISPPSVPTPLVPLRKGEKKGAGGAKYKLVESGDFQLDAMASSGVPERLIVTVTLPENAEPTRKLDVVVGPKRLTIGVAGDPEDQPPRYLDISLPYLVEVESKCSAKRDKRGVLTITMPVKRAAQPRVSLPAPVYSAEESAATVASSAEEDEGGSTNVAEPNKHPTKTQVDHSRWVDKPQLAEKFEFPTAQADSRTAEHYVEGDVNEEFFHDAVGARELSEEDSDAGEIVDLRVAEGEAFFASARFVKPVPGYHFKTGDQGCGYYREEGQEPQIEWSQNEKIVTGLVYVSGIVADTIRMEFNEKDEGTVMALSFWGAGQEERPKERAFYSSVLDLPGGVDVQNCTYGAADMNLMVRLVKNPMVEWASFPCNNKRLPARHEDAQSIDTLIDTTNHMGQPAAPGHGGGMGNARFGGERLRAARKEDFGGLAFQLD